MSIKTELALLALRPLIADKYELSEFDEFHEHFQDFGRWEWIEIANEGRRIWSLLYQEEVTYHSAQSALIHAVSAQAFYGALDVVSAALGLDSQVLACTLGPWTDRQDDPPPAMTLDNFMQTYQEEACRLQKELSA
jgi:hypothetical protein